MKQIMAIAIIPLFLLLVLIVVPPVIIGIYVYKDASERGMNAVPWTLLAIFAPGFVGLIIYLIVRSSTPDARCHKCSILLLLLILVPLSLCILLVLGVTFFGFSNSSTHFSSYSYSTETSVTSESKNYPFLKDWVASCDIEGTGSFSSKSEAHLTYLAPHEYSAKELMEPGL